MPKEPSTARQRAGMPPGVNAIVNRRRLGADFPQLAFLLRPGQRVLDVGCAGGALTRGVAEAVGPGGQVVGADVDARLIGEARAASPDLPQLSFVQADICDLPFEAQFDLVCAARVLQWLDRPGLALQQLVRAVRPGGLVVVLDYNHEKIVQAPAPPAAFLAFHARYQAWRADAGMDNAIADHLAGLFAQAGLHDIQTTAQHEVARRGEPDFLARAGLKVGVIASRGPQLVEEGWLTEAERAAAEQEGRRWLHEQAEQQTLYLLAVTGRRPA